VRDTWSLYRSVLDILPGKARRFLVIYSFLLAVLSVLDAAALGLLAVVIGPIVSGSKLTLPLIGEVGDAGLIIMLGLVCVLIIMKGALSLLVIWRATRVFANYELELGSRLFDSYMASSWVERLKRNSSDIVRLTDGSVSTTISGFVLPATTIVGEVLSFVTIIVVLWVAQPVVALIAFFYLSLLGVVLFFGVTKRTRQAGKVVLRFSLRSSRLITEMVGALKEVTLRNKGEEAARVVKENRRHATRARSNAQFLAQSPRYVIESGIVGGFVLVGFAGFVMDGLTGATTAVALFGLAGFRLAPSVVRFQTIVSQVTVATPHAQRVVAEIRRSEASSAESALVPQRPMPSAPAEILVDRVSFRYSTTNAEDAVSEVTMRIPFGSAVALVGASGAGKSTMVDLLLGLMEPTTGAISIDGIPLNELKVAWRSRVGYVPQDVSLFDRTVAQNVALSWTDDLDDDRVRQALSLAQMLPTIEARDGGIHSLIGERGLALSGGQRQRLGIARALYADPLVLVMDEATSALDTATEAAVTDAIKKLRGSITIITVAHRLSTVKESDMIFFMRDGRVAAQGTFAELVAKEPDFAIQARLAGLAGANP
jgi:ABC-type multidrug transport system fused ATPase/permease subunit